LCVLLLECSILAGQMSVEILKMISHKVRFIGACYAMFAVADSYPLLL